jgi:CRP/FNR family cyclic AMP-dependent transcriptional regulator
MDAAPKKLPSTDETAAVLNEVLRLESFFPEFKAEHLEKLFPRSGLYEYPQNFSLVQQGEAARDLFIIVSGRVAIRQEFGSAAAELATLSAKDIIGEMALLRDGQRTASGVVSEPSRIYRLSYDDVQYLLQNNPELSAHLKGLAARRTS